MKNNGAGEYTLKWSAKTLKFLSKHTDLNNPESVKSFIASLTSGDGYKHNLCLSYDKYAKYCGIEWKMPTYKRTDRRIKLPTKEKLEMLIASARKPLNIKLQMSMETGLRPVELCNLKVKDIDLTQRLVYPTTAKNGASRTLKISNSLTAQLIDHITSNSLAPNDKLFKGTAENYSKYYRQRRNALAKKLQDPTIHLIRLYDFRHYFATMTYHKTKDILFTKQQMGHKKLETTLIYTQLLNLNDDEWTCKTAKNVTEATQLIEAGFEYITEIDGLKLFRKRK